MDPLTVFPNQCPQIDTTSKGEFGAFNYISNGEEVIAEDNTMIRGRLNGVLRGYIPVRERPHGQRPFKYIQRYSDFRRVAEVNPHHEHEMLEIVAANTPNGELTVRSDFYPINYVQVALNFSSILWELSRDAARARQEQRQVPTLPQLENFIVTDSMNEKFVINTIHNSEVITLEELKLLYPHIITMELVREIIKKIATSLVYLHNFEKDVYCVYLSLCTESVQVMLDENQNILNVMLGEFGNAKLVPTRVRSETYLSDLTDIMLGLFPPCSDFNGYLPPEYYHCQYLGDPRSYGIRSIDMWMTGMVMLRLISVFVDPFPPTDVLLSSDLFHVLHQPNVFEIMNHFYGQKIGADGVDLLIRLLRPLAQERLSAQDLANHPFITQNYHAIQLPPPETNVDAILDEINIDMSNLDEEMDNILEISPMEM